jgi:hypothetical protein
MRILQALRPQFFPPLPPPYMMAATKMPVGFLRLSVVGPSDPKCWCTPTSESTPDPSRRWPLLKMGSPR